MREITEKRLSKSTYNLSSPAPFGEPVFCIFILILKLTHIMRELTQIARRYNRNPKKKDKLYTAYIE